MLIRVKILFRRLLPQIRQNHHRPDRQGNPRKPTRPQTGIKLFSPVILMTGLYLAAGFTGGCLAGTPAVQGHCDRRNVTLCALCGKVSVPIIRVRQC